MKNKPSESASHAELVKIFEIGKCYAECKPITIDDTFTVRLVKCMAFRLIKIEEQHSQEAEENKRLRSEISLMIEDSHSSFIRIKSERDNYKEVLEWIKNHDISKVSDAQNMRDFAVTVLNQPSRNITQSPNSKTSRKDLIDSIRQ